jgi:oxygen-dependent protoporphyrinogen oxidase
VTPQTAHRRVAVIGAGPAGCAAAFELRRAGREVVLFERGAAPGGRTASWRGHGVTVDTGAGFFTNFYPRTRRYVAELGLEDDVLELARTNGLVHEGRIARLELGSMRSFLAYPHLRLRDLLRVALYTARQTARRRRLDLADPETLAPLDDGDIAGEARRAMGERAYQFLVRPAVEPFWYFGCEEASRALLMALQAHAADARFFAFRSGADTLCRRLAAAVETRTGREVQAVAPDGAGLRVRHRADAEGEAEEVFDAVVVATPASEADTLTAGLAEPLVTPAQREFLRSQRYAANVHVLYRVARGVGAGGLDNLFPCGPGRSPVAGIGFHARKHAAAGAVHDHDFVSVYLSDPAARTLLDAAREHVAGEAWKLARDLHPGLPPEAEPIEVFARPHAIPVPAPGRYRSAARFLAGQRPPLVFAGDHLATATIEGAVHTGQSAARRLLDGAA